ncbi:alpha-amylase family glycosyl hydrolase [Acholeplasma hippikon]|uniref:Pullulanase n=1 Tax=Acholeplasma hippikon TaxID=264636 RepID=A0A449BIJ3_9MOLU|nr:alpha-amylase family glycosyl hydrolase [Acholeplasma hippikon]VEU82275.1 Pullulanase [Acholeplasma hippikon]
MKAFIDDFNLIRIESNVYISHIGIEGYQLYWLKNENGNQYFKTDKNLELHLVDHIWINEVSYPLSIGLITLQKSFNQKFKYDGPLGYQYTKEKTTFTVFSPVAKEIILDVNGSKYPMTYEKPVWTVEVSGDLESLPYHYEIRLVDEFETATDPYNIASNLTDSIIIDLTKVEKEQYDFVKLKKYTDAVIYEGHIRDLSLNLDVVNKGTFLGVTEHSEKLNGSVLEYIKNLGITHLQLLPVFDFYGVDDIEKSKAYNWGYNPMQYFAIDGWLSRNPNDPYERIKEFKKVVDEAHKLNLGIVMDVVYNHVYERALFPYDVFAPGYFYRHDKNFKQTHSCFLENDVETTNYMVRRLILDSLEHFVRFYKVDGFRFDLMGLLDNETMNLAYERLVKINPSIILYGEGWNMDTAVTKKLRSNMANQATMKKIGHFNDFYRNIFKGQLHTKELGYATGHQGLSDKAMLGILGSPHMFDSPIKSINYVECHDNLTLFDTLSFNYDKLEVKQIYQDLNNHLIAISQGVPFYHAGQEMYRSKNGVENSYNSSDEINSIKWYDYKSISKFRQILKIRKLHSVYRFDKYVKKGISIEKIENYIYYELQTKDYTLSHYIKNDFKKSTLPNDGKLIFTSQKVNKQNGFIYADKPGVYIIKRKR